MSINPYSIPINRQCLILDYLISQFNPKLTDCKKLILNQLELGLIQPTFQSLVRNDLVDTIEETEYSFQIKHENWQELAQLLQNTAYKWYKQHIFDGWRNENFDVFDDNQQSLFTLERSAFRPFGFKSHAVHINAWVNQANKQPLYWIAKRSANKTVSPNKLDNIVGGGVSSSETPKQALIREAYEEANIPEILLQPLTASTTYFSYRPVQRGLHREFLHIYNLKLASHFIPQNIDGEVADFQQMNADEISLAILDNQFMPDSILSLLNLFLQHQVIDVNGQLAQWLKKHLKSF